MCGIVGYTGSRPALGILIQGLKRLEYRGYDSSGIAVHASGKISIRKSEGKLENVESLIRNENSAEVDALRSANCGIGHTRWATHGKPTTQNAHPHQTGHVVLVHNGIIENYLEIKKELVSRGHKPKSETDSELFGFLVLEEMESGKRLAEAVRAAFVKLEGSCSVVVMSEREPGLVIGVRNGSPLVAASDPQGGALLASDAQPLMEYTRDVVFLENGDMAIGTKEGLRVVSVKDGRELRRESSRLDWSPERMDKQGYPHYMLKEIHEQPAALVDTLNGILDRAKGDPFPLAIQPGVELLKKAKGLTLIACGTSWHAALAGKYWIEKLARIPVNVELASEFRYRDPVIAPDSLVVGISQSGETADTLAVLRDLKSKGIRRLAITNVRGSSIARDADATFYTLAGPEIGVAATKTFLSQMMVLLLWAGYLGEQSGRDCSAFFQDTLRLPHLLKDELQAGSAMTTAVTEIANQLQSIRGFFFIGRGYSYPIALEGALKLKEIAYVHAEGYAAGELKHGPIAMIDENMAVVVLAPRDAWRDKTVSNLEEVKARGAKIIGIGERADESLKGLCDYWIPLPGQIDEALLPFLVTPALQLLSYEIALLRGTDVDKPRNLAKSVTVE